MSLDLFSQVALSQERMEKGIRKGEGQAEIGRQAALRCAAKHQEQTDKLVKLAQELAKKAYPKPIIMANVRLAAVQRGILTPGVKGTGRKLSGLGAVAKLAGLKPGGWQRSFIEGSRGNLHREWYAA